MIDLDQSDRNITLYFPFILSMFIIVNNICPLQQLKDSTATNKKSFCA